MAENSLSNINQILIKNSYVTKLLNEIEDNFKSLSSEL